jgi:cytochrome d ubiquinol oxidase subunit II
MDLALLWFLLLGALLFGYAVLDGFDLGTGIVHLFAAESDQERRILINAIGPLWDGNEVWLVTFGGALFAAFPPVYAAVFSGLYVPFMLLLFALIFRAVAIEFRSKRPSAAWRRGFDGAFAGASFLATLLMGTAVGAIVWGLPISEGGMFTGGLADIVHPFSLLVGLMSVALFGLHGTVYLRLKTEGELQERLTPWAWRFFGVFVTLFVLVTVIALIERPRVAGFLAENRLAYGVVIAAVLAIGNVPRSLFSDRWGQAFVSSIILIGALVVLFGAAIEPALVPSTVDPALSLTIHNAASSPKTLGIMTIMAGIGMPLVISYTAVVYWTFRGKVKLDDFSY